MSEPTPATVPSLWSVQRLAKHWSMKEDSIRCMVRRGQLKAVKLGRTVYFDEADLLAFLDAKRKAS